MAKKIKPNIVSGGSAIDLGNGLFYLRGRTHEEGGIDIGSNPETGIEAENGEIYDVYKGRVFSAQPIFNGISPANALLMGGNPNSIFNAQELWKQEHRVNDDGTKFKDGGYTPSKEIIDYIKKTEAFRDKWYKDGNGIDTIGYGFTGSRIKKLYPNGITREQADKEFADSIAKRALILAKDTPNWNKLSQNQRDALLSYHYNVGESSYRNKHPKLQEALRKQDWENVMLNIDAGYNDKKNPGLRTRRDYERQLFRSGINASSTGDEEKAFRDWYNTYARAHNLDLNPDAKEHYYDYRAYYKNRTKEQANEEWKLDNHLPDTYKLPGHPTFSVESIYSTRKTPGGTWKKVGLGPVYDEQFFDSKYTKNLRKYQNVSFKMGGIGPKNIIGIGGRKIIGKIVKDKYLTDYINKGQVIGYPTPLTFLNYVFSPYKNEYNRLNVDESSSYEMPRYGENLRRNLLAMYLGYGDSDKVWYKNNIVESKYKPSVSKNADSKYYTFNGDIIEGFKYTAGQHKIDKGNDENGNYISFYDVWDLAPFSGKGNELSGIGGKPIELYDRIYEDNWRYKDALDLYNSQERLKQKYGGIHIKPSKRGTFTAAAKRHNMGVQEFARTVLNNKANYSTAMVKKANFARNANKWHKKEFGGNMTKQYFITPNNIYKLGEDIRKKAALGAEDVIPIRKIKVNNRDAWDVDGKIVYSEAEAYRLARRFADAQGTLDMSETLEPSIVTAERNTSSINDAIPISKIKVNGKDAWDVDGRIIFNEQEAYRYRSRLADIQGSLDMSEELNPSVVTAERTYRSARPGVRQNTIGFTDSLAGTSYYGPQRTNELPAPQTPTQPTQATQPATPQRSQYSTIRIDTSGRPTRGLGVTSLRPYDGRPIETQAQTPTSGSQSSSTGGQRRTTRSSVPTTPIIPIDYDSIDNQINESNQRILRESLYTTLEPLTTIASPGAVAPQTIVDNNRRGPVRLRGNGINIRNGADWLGLGINLAGNLASSLINRSAIKRLNYGDAPIPLSAQKLKTEINVNPQVDQIRENVAGQERLIADNTADSRVALARRQRARNFGTEQFQSLMGQKENMETQLINRDRLNRQGIDAQNVTRYNQWRRGAYDFENRRREMLAENAVAGINNAAEAIAGERGILARREGRNRDILNAALIAATSPNAQNVIGSKEFAKFLEQLGYTGDFSLLRKRLNIG